MAASADATFFRFQAGAVAGGDPAVALRELNDRMVVFRLEALAGRKIHVDITAHRRPGLRLLTAELSGISHGAAPAPSDDDELLFASVLSGRSAVRQRGRELMLTDGAAVLISRADGVFTVIHPERVRFLGLRVARAAVAPLLGEGELGDAVMKPIPRATSAVPLLVSYLAAVTEQRQLATPAHHGLISRHVHDLVALIAGARGEGAALAAARSLRAVRLGAVQADMLANLDDPDLGVAWIAARHRVTPRYVHKLFEETGRTFSQFVLDRRLAAAYRALIDPAHRDRSISEVAFAAGFGDLSYFNRSFRRRYGATPSDVRAGVLTPRPTPRRPDRGR